MIALRRHLDRMRTWLFGPPTIAAPPSEEAAAQCDWCLVGNVVDEHPFGEAKALRPGSKHFTPGTKVYCIPPLWGDGYEQIAVVGICRGSRRWITVVMPAKRITNWRAKVVYKPGVRQRLRDGYQGSRRQWKSREEVEAFAAELKARAEAAA